MGGIFFFRLYSIDKRNLFYALRKCHEQIKRRNREIPLKISDILRKKRDIFGFARSININKIHHFGFTKGSFCKITFFLTHCPAKVTFR